MEQLTSSTLVDILQTVGVWGLIVIVCAILLYERHKSKVKINEADASTKNAIDLQSLIAQRDAKTLEMFTEFATDIVSKINTGVVHTVEDEERNCKLNSYLDDALRCLMEKTDAHRAFIFSYHNGEKSIDGRGYQKMSCTNEVTVSWVSPIMADCQNMQRAMVPSVYKNLISKETYFVDDVESLKESDPVSYAFIKKHGAQSLYLHSLKRDDGLVTGFIGIEYVNDCERDVTMISKYLEKKALKVTGAILGDNSQSFHKDGVV